MILSLGRKHVQPEQFDVCLCPLFCVECVRPNVRQLVQGGVVIFRAERNNLVVQVCLTKFMMVLCPASTRRYVMVKIKFLKLDALLVGDNIDQPNNWKPARSFALIHTLGKVDLKSEV